MKKVIKDLKSIGTEVKLTGKKYKDKIASYDISDSEIKGGRAIVEIKSNQLFTGRFEEGDVINFLHIWSSYQENKVEVLEGNLLQEANIIIKNYRGEVCPIELLLYTSNIVSNKFSNRRLTTETANTVAIIAEKNPNFLLSIKHIAEVWQWPHIINICAIATGILCARTLTDPKPAELLRTIFNNYRYNEQTRLGCFIGIINSKRDEFIPDILNIVHDLKGSDTDLMIGKIFKSNFLSNFPSYYDQFNEKMFWNSSPYVKRLVHQLMQYGLNDNNFIERYKNANSEEDRTRIVEEALQVIRGGIKAEVTYAVNFLKMIATVDISEKMYKMLDLKNNTNSDSFPIIKYFSQVSYSKAIHDMINVKRENNYYAACRVALFRLNELSTEDFILNFLLETRMFQLRMYINGFFGIPSNAIPEIKNALYTFFSEPQVEESIKIAINNYEMLVKQYRHFYDERIGEIFKSFFAYNTVFSDIQIKIIEQNACLSIFETIINSSNYKKYEDFLYYVAEENTDFSTIISNHAKQILRNINSDKIKI